MGLKSLVDDEKDSRERDECPCCEEQGEETPRVEIRCVNSDCEVLYFIPTDYSVDTYDIVGDDLHGS